MTVVFQQTALRTLARIRGRTKTPSPEHAMPSRRWLTFPDLTPREREVLDRLADGARNSEIAGSLE
jgi:DNA-binding NarL/FixJ family response regulator